MDRRTRKTGLNLIHWLLHNMSLVSQQRKWICCSMSLRWWTAPPMCPYRWTARGVPLSTLASMAVWWWQHNRRLEPGTQKCLCKTLDNENGKFKGIIQTSWQVQSFIFSFEKEMRRLCFLSISRKLNRNYLWKSSNLSNKNAWFQLVKYEIS